MSRFDPTNDELRESLRSHAKITLDLQNRIVEARRAAASHPAILQILDTPHRARVDGAMQDSALEALLKMGDDLHASMGTDLDGTEFKDDEIAYLLTLAASTVHLIRELREARTDVPALLAEVEQLRAERADEARAALADTVPAQKVRALAERLRDRAKGAADEGWRETVLLEASAHVRALLLDEEADRG